MTEVEGLRAGERSGLLQLGNCVCEAGSEGECSVEGLLVVKIVEGVGEVCGRLRNEGGRRGLYRSHLASAGVGWIGLVELQLPRM